MTDDCSRGDVVCILKYNDSTVDIVINYSVLAVTTVPYLIIDTSISRTHKVALFVSYFVFQIALCCLLGCSGISIIWCALYGTLLYDIRRRPLTILSVGLIDFTAIAYYALTTVPITTIAHACALLMGFSCALAATRGGPSVERKQTGLLDSDGTNFSPALPSAHLLTDTRTGLSEENESRSQEKPQDYGDIGDRRNHK